MIIRLLLIIAVLSLLLWFLASRKTVQVKAIKKIGLLGLGSLAIISILLPDITNEIAHHVGVGRGADLLLYLLFIAFVAAMLNLYIKGREDEVVITSLARKLALLEVEVKREKK